MVRYQADLPDILGNNQRIATKYPSITGSLRVHDGFITGGYNANIKPIKRKNPIKIANYLHIHIKSCTFVQLLNIENLI